MWFGFLLTYINPLAVFKTISKILNRKRDWEPSQKSVCYFLKNSKQLNIFTLFLVNNKKANKLKCHIFNS